MLNKNDSLCGTRQIHAYTQSAAEQFIDARVKMVNVIIFDWAGTFD